MNETFKVNKNEYLLSDTFFTKACKLRGFNAADEYMILTFPPNELNPSSKILIISDEFGALSLAYHQFNPVIILDSEISKNAILQNFKNNSINSDKLQFFSPLAELKNTFDYIFIVAPKSTDILQFYLSSLHKWASDSTNVAISVMIKHMPNNFYKLVSKYAQIRSLRIVKKARICLLSHFKKEYFSFEKEFILNTKNYFSYKSVFSSGKEDQGTSFLLKHLPPFNASEKILDLACGFGQIGVELSTKYQSSVSFVDESFLALESAKKTVLLNQCLNTSFYLNDQLQGLPNNYFDVIVTNPPFHLKHTISEQLSYMLFLEAKKKLKGDAQFYLVFNRHLNYPKLLRKLFHTRNLLGENKKFKVFQCQD